MILVWFVLNNKYFSQSTSIQTVLSQSTAWCIKTVKVLFEIKIKFLKLKYVISNRIWSKTHGVSTYTTQQMVFNSPCLTDKKEFDSSWGYGSDVIIKSVFSWQFTKNCMVSTHHICISEELASLQGQMACGKGSGKFIFGN